MKKTTAKTQTLLRYRLIGTREIHIMNLQGCRILKTAIECADGMLLQFRDCDWHEFETVEISA